MTYPAAVGLKSIHFVVPHPGNGVGYGVASLVMALIQDSRTGMLKAAPVVAVDLDTEPQP